MRSWPRRGRSRPPAPSSSRCRRSRRARRSTAWTASGACAAGSTCRRCRPSGATRCCRTSAPGSTAARASPAPEVFDGYSQMGALRDAAVARLPAVRLRAVAGEPGADLCRRVGGPDQRSGAAARAHRLHAAVQHERAAGRVDQLRLHVDGLADRPADHRPPARRPGRAAGGAGVRADASRRKGPGLPFSSHARFVRRPPEGWPECGAALRQAATKIHAASAAAPSAPCTAATPRRRSCSTTTPKASVSTA